MARCLHGYHGAGDCCDDSPAIGRSADRAAEAIDVWAELGELRRPSVITAMSVTVLASGAMFAVFTYIAPIIHEQTHGSPSFLTAILVLYGIGLTVGNWLGGRYADRSLDATLIVVLASLSGLLLLFAVHDELGGPRRNLDLRLGHRDLCARPAACKCRC